MLRLAVALLLALSIGAQDRHEGFVTFRWDAETGRVLWELDEFDRELLYVVSVASGLGSNPIGIDRGSLGPQHVVEFRRVGPKVLLVAKNLGYRANTFNASEHIAVTESFAESVLWGFEIEDSTDSGAVLVDATPFLLRDAANIAERVNRGGSGSYRLDKSRSAVRLSGTRAFPDNSEFEMTTTFVSDRADRRVREVAATGEAFTIRQRHSLIRLPDHDYSPRRADPRVGYMTVQFQDYTVPLGEPMTQRYIARHRLEKVDPKSEFSEVKEPIVYYLDPGTPEPVRTALKQGASWWAEAFERAGFRNAFRVEDLPDGADALDVRYNIIHWVHRSTRGWSYGTSIRDPRTGEILKGCVLLGSLRVRQDHMIFGGLGAGGEACCAGGAPGASYLLPGGDDRRRELALARIRQLAAHEVGHTLGLTHNFAASTYDRASVMDYPAPWIRIKNGEISFDAAYDTGIGEYDIFAIRYGYSQFPPHTDEKAALQRIVDSGLKQGMLYLTDQDARAASTMDARAALWDNGSDPVAELLNARDVRDRALRSFGAAQLRDGQSWSDLERDLVPLWLHWRYQLDAAVKLVGGVEYRHATKGDGQDRWTRVELERQRQALRACLSLLTIDRLTLPERILKLIPPTAPGDSPRSERFPRTAGALLDPVDTGLVAADLVVGALLEPTRLARCLEGLEPAGVLSELIETTVLAARVGDRTQQRVQRAVDALVVDRLMQLAASTSARADVRAAARESLRGLSSDLRTGRPHSGPVDGVASAHHGALWRRIEAYLSGREGAPPLRSPSLSTPPGSPIGASSR